MINPHVVRKMHNPDNPPAEVGMHWINISTREEFFSVGTLDLSDWIPRRRSGFRSYTITITQQMLDDKFAILPFIPVNPDEVILVPAGGIQQLNGVDFEVTGNILSWDSLGLDNFLEVNDVLIMQH